jgi:hypothetical protein
MHLVERGERTSGHRLRTGVSSPSAMSRFVRPHAAIPGSSIALPMTPNIYYRRQPSLTNNFQVFTQLRHECYQYW